MIQPTCYRCRLPTNEKSKKIDEHGRVYHRYDCMIRLPEFAKYFLVGNDRDGYIGVWP
jgi:hypothetical protein